ncbi:HdeA/HdeB family chaperone [Lentisalinibacter orientalis]|uniref:HdeA/HdeB family chaperone n=1 Tax=Lentisalinibacter orientalis TaxID=2992241 RepID=UPI003869CB18
MRSYRLVPLVVAVVLAAGSAYAEDAEVAASDVTRVTCSDLALASEENRAFALMFYYGYLAGRSNVSVIDNSLVADHLLQVRDYCAGHPESTVVDAFVAALREKD